MYKVEALAREADETPWEFEFAGDVYRLPSQPDARVFAAIDGNRFDQALGLLLGDDQWTRMQQSQAVFTMAALEGLLRAYFSELGIELEKSAASTV